MQELADGEEGCEQRSSGPDMASVLMSTQAAVVTAA